MEEKSQGAVEYLLMVAAAIAVVGSIVVMVRNLSTDLGSRVDSDIENIRRTVVNILTS